MKVVITGGTGLIGSTLTRSLRENGHEVIILTRDPKRHEPPAEGAQLVKWDAQTAAGWVEAADGADAIVNLAGATINHRWTDSYKKTIMDSRINSGKAVVAAIKAMQHKPKVVIQASAVGYYGPRQEEVVTEETPAGNDFLAEVCKAWEASTEEVEAMGVRRCIIRTGIVLSTQEGAMAQLLPIFKLFAGGPVGSGEQYYPWIHLGDEVEAIRYLMECEDCSGVYNLSAPNPVKNKVFVKALGNAVSRPAIAPAPGFAIKLMFGEMATIVLDGQRAVPERLQAAGYDFRFTEPENAMRNLLYSGYEKN
jgi:uncharacterized protein (TIGR01777 family)